MGKKRCADEQIAFALRPAESATVVADFVRSLKQLVAELSLDTKMLPACSQPNVGSCCSACSHAEDAGGVPGG